MLPLPTSSATLSTVAHSLTSPPDLTSPLTFLICLQRLHTTVPLLTLFLLSPVPASVSCHKVWQRCVTSHVPPLVIWLCCYVDKDSVDTPGPSERAKGSGSKICHGHQTECVLGVCVWANNALGVHLQTLLPVSHPHEDFLRLPSEINAFPPELL